MFRSNCSSEQNACYLPAVSVTNEYNNLTIRSGVDVMDTSLCHRALLSLLDARFAAVGGARTQRTSRLACRVRAVAATCVWL
jgi:hypothetical protein